MNLNAINENYYTSGQISVDDVDELAAQGYKTIICARPDNEDDGQPSFAEISAKAQTLGISAHHIPVSGPLNDAQIKEFAKIMHNAEGPILGYCRSGGRAANLYKTLE